METSERIEDPTLEHVFGQVVKYVRAKLSKKMTFNQRVSVWTEFYGQQVGIAFALLPFSILMGWAVWGVVDSTMAMLFVSFGTMAIMYLGINMIVDTIIRLTAGHQEK